MIVVFCCTSSRAFQHFFTPPIFRDCRCRHAAIAGIIGLLGRAKGGRLSARHPSPRHLQSVRVIDWIQINLFMLPLRGSTESMLGLMRSINAHGVEAFRGPDRDPPASHHAAFHRLPSTSVSHSVKTWLTRPSAAEPVHWAGGGSAARSPALSEGPFCPCWRACACFFSFISWGTFGPFRWTQIGISVHFSHVSHSFLLPGTE